MDFGIAETGIARGSPPGTTTEVLRFGVPFAEIRVVSVEESTPAPQVESEAPAAEAALPEASVVEGKCSAVGLIFPIE
jgi:hypothetical protein